MKRKTMIKKLESFILNGQHFGIKEIRDAKCSKSNDPTITNKEVWESIVKSIIHENQNSKVSLVPAIHKIAELEGQRKLDKYVKQVEKGN